MHTRNSKAVHAQVQKNTRTRWSIKHAHAQFKIMHTRRSMKTRASQIVFNRESFPFLPQAKYTDSLIKLLKTDMNKVRRQLFLFSFSFLFLILILMLVVMKKEPEDLEEESSPLTPHVFRVWHFFFYVSFSFHHRSKHTWTVASWSQLTLSPWKKTV